VALEHERSCVAGVRNSLAVTTTEGPKTAACKAVGKCGFTLHTCLWLRQTLWHSPSNTLIGQAAAYVDAECEPQITAIQNRSYQKLSD
jgi:hypothetical protein